METDSGMTGQLALQRGDSDRHGSEGRVPESVGLQLAHRPSKTGMTAMLSEFHSAASSDEILVGYPGSSKRQLLSRRTYSRKNRDASTLETQTFADSSWFARLRSQTRAGANSDSDVSSPVGSSPCRCLDYHGCSAAQCDRAEVAPLIAANAHAQVRRCADCSCRDRARCLLRHSRHRIVSACAEVQLESDQQRRRANWTQGAAQTRSRCDKLLLVAMARRRMKTMPRPRCGAQLSH